MLILRRKAGETLLIGDEVKVTVMDIYEGSVRLAIDAPKRIPILRSELLQAADANRDAAHGQPGELANLLSRDTSEKPKSRQLRPLKRLENKAAASNASLPDEPDRKS